MSSTEQTISMPMPLAQRLCKEYTGRPNWDALEPDRLAATVELRALLAQPAAQHQGEPVALPGRRTEDYFFSEKLRDKAEGWNAYHDEIAKLGPLYTHAVTAAGEVEQGYHNSVVEGLVSRQNELREERDTLRAEVDQFKLANARLSKENVERRNQLAERDALLRDINKRHSSGVDFDLPADLAARVAAVCATSAEPSAPVERDDPCTWTDRQVLDFLGVALRNVDIEGVVRLSEIRQGFEYMRNRAILERKP